MAPGTRISHVQPILRTGICRRICVIAKFQRRWIVSRLERFSDKPTLLVVCNEFVHQNLKPFLSVDTELTDEDYVIDYLISHKDIKGRRSYLVKWRNYPRSKATWEPRENLTINAETLVLDYEKLHTHAQLHNAQPWCVFDFESKR